MFDHELYDVHDFESIPLNQDLYIVDEVYLKEYDRAMIQFFNGADYQYVGFVSPMAARKINNTTIELSWYPNTYDRFHEVSVSLPRNQFIACVGSWQYDEKPRIFVRSDWLELIHVRSYSIFAMVDAIGVKKALEDGAITRESLLDLRNHIDNLAGEFPNISFISFADSLLIKSNWTVGHHDSDIKYSYDPEIFIHLANKLNEIYLKSLGLGAYAVIAQGSNEYYEDNLLHISDSGNHISLNSLGIPFAQIMEIESTARKALKSGVHPPSDLYMDEKYYRSLNFEYGFEKNKKPSNAYQSKMIGTPSKYYYSDFSTILSNLEAGD